MAKDYPVGKAQRMVLDALGLKANTFSEADKIFYKHGIVVSSKRVGRRVVPVVTKIEPEVAVQRNYGGDYDIGYETNYTEIDLSPIKQWME